MKYLYCGDGRIERKLFSFSRDVKPLKIFKELRFNVALGNTKAHGNVWQHVWLAIPMKPCFIE